MTNGAGDGPEFSTEDTDRYPAVQNQDEATGDRQFQALIEAVEEYAIVRLDPDGHVVSWNAGAKEINGYTDAEIVGEHFSTLYTDADREASVPDENLAAAAAHGSVEDEGWRVRADGSRIWANVTISAIHDEDGGLEGFAKVTRDMSERREYERQLEGKAERLEREREDIARELGEMFGRIDDGFFALDEEWRFTYVNEHGENILGRSEGELLGRVLWDAFPEARGSQGEEELRRAMETLESVTYEEYFEPLDSWFEVRAFPSDSGLSVYFRDITERKERERELEEYERIIETVDDGIYVNDEEFRFRFVNEAYASLMGRSREELIGSHVTAAVDEETLENAASLLSEISPGEGGTHEFEIDAADGTRTLETKFIVLGDDAGGYAGSVGILRDTTERNERERQLARFERMVETVNDGVYVTDGEGRIVFVNDAFVSISQHTSEELLGAHGSIFFGERFVDTDEEEWRELVDGERDAVEFETEIIGPNGEARVVHNRFVPLEMDGEVGSVGVTRDITELKEYQRKLEESNERLEQFAYVASHDLQEPLRMVSNYLQLLESRCADDLDGDGREFIGFAVDGADRMREMIDDLLTYSRIDTEARPPEPTDAEAVVENVLQDLALQIQETDAHVDVGPLPTVHVDPNLLEQVFQNLVSNAIKYRGDDPPHIEIWAERDAGEWVVHVADNGIGIEPEHTDRIFEVFYRLHTREEYPGTGIGLALCKKIVDRHGGEIRVESAPGNGSTFSVTLPPG